MLTQKEQEAKEKVIEKLSESIIEELKNTSTVDESILKVMLDGLSNLMQQD